MPYKSLETFLAQKPLFYDTIDYTRMPRIFQKIRHRFAIPKIIHIVGTNGKGTTGRFIAWALYRAGFSVGHYTSPHIVRFNERIWIDGSDADDETLQNAHRRLLEILDEEAADALSYFEYTTLLAMYCFLRCDYVVLEAGLGGEYDATAVFPSILTLSTVIDFDHKEFLGDTIDAIARTKLNAAQTRLVIAKQKHKTVYTVAREIAKAKKIDLFFVEEAPPHDKAFVEEFSKNNRIEPFLRENLLSAVSVLRLLNVKFDQSSFFQAKLAGRMHYIAENIVVDVGHNPLAAEAIAEALAGKRFILVYNAFKDKDIESVLKKLKPLIEKVAILDIDSHRTVARAKLQKTLKELKIQYETFKRIDDKKRYLVFGSFSVVEEFLKRAYA